MQPSNGEPGSDRSAVKDQLLHVHDEATFVAQLEQKSSFPFVLYGLIALNIAVWLQGVARFSPGQYVDWTPSALTLLDWGANASYPVLEDGQYWRLLTATFEHANFGHLFGNMLVLWIFGRYTSRWYGNLQFGLIYLGSALFGSSLSLHYSAFEGISVGASGAVFGVLAAVVVGVLEHRNRVPNGVFWRMMASQGAYLVYSVWQGLSVPHVDNAAHIGGVLAGGLMAWMMVEKIEPNTTLTQRRKARVKAISAVGTGFAALLMLATSPPYDLHKVLREQVLIDQVWDRVRSIETAAANDALDTNVSPQQLATAVRVKYLPGLQQCEMDFLALPLSADNPRTAVAELMLNFVREEMSYWSLMLLSTDLPAGLESTALEEQAKIHVRLRNQTLGKLRDAGWADGMQDAI
jgi:rhomboid protease GluP